MDDVTNPQIRVRLVVRNVTKKELTLYLEPWGEECQMVSQSEFILIGYGPESGSGFLIDYDEDRIVVTGWTGSAMRVFSNGKEIGSISWRPPVPDIDSPLK